MNQYITVDEFKGRIALQDGDIPAVTGIIEAASRWIDNYCHRNFYVWYGTRYFKGARNTLYIPSPFDLLSVTSLWTDPLGQGAWPFLFAPTDFVLANVDGYDSLPYTKIYLADCAQQRDFAPGTLRGVKILGIWGYGDGSSRGAFPYLANGVVLPTDGLTDPATALALATGQGALFSAGTTLRIDTEDMYVPIVSGDVLTLERGVNGTTAVAHSEGAAIYIAQYHRIVKEACTEQSVKWWKRRESAYASKIGDQTNGIVQVYHGLDADVETMLNNSHVRRVI